MGYYIETGSAHGKAQAIVNEHGARIVTLPEAEKALKEGKGVVCAVFNGAFDAAAFIYSEREMEDFSWGGDRRPKQWLVMDRALAEKLSGYKA